MSFGEIANFWTVTFFVFLVSVKTEKLKIIRVTIDTIVKIIILIFITQRYVKINSPNKKNSLNFSTNRNMLNIYIKITKNDKKIVNF